MKCSGLNNEKHAKVRDIKRIVTRAFIPLDGGEVTLD